MGFSRQEYWSELPFFSPGIPLSSVCVCVCVCVYIHMYVCCMDAVCCCLVTKLCLTLREPMAVACQVPLSMAFPRQEFWSGLPFPSPGDLPHPETESVSPA